MKAALFAVIFSLGARKNNGALFLNSAPLFSEPLEEKNSNRTHL
jgi:hypothetical protein